MPLRRRRSPAFRWRPAELITGAGWTGLDVASPAGEVFLQALAGQSLQQLRQRPRRHRSQFCPTAQYHRGNRGQIPLGAELGQQPFGHIRNALTRGHRPLGSSRLA